jgi:hypothetical protein
MPTATEFVGFNSQAVTETRTGSQLKHYSVRAQLPVVEIGVENFAANRKTAGIPFRSGLQYVIEKSRESELWSCL